MTQVIYFFKIQIQAELLYLSLEKRYSIGKNVKYAFSYLTLYHPHFS